MTRDFRLEVVLLACGLLASGCGTYQNLKGHARLATDQPLEGVQLLEEATRLAPTDAGFKVDYLRNREAQIRGLLTQADDLRAEGRLAEAGIGYDTVLKMDRGNAKALAALAALPQDARYGSMLAEGEAFLAQGRIDLAIESAARVLEVHPQHRRAARLRNEAMDQEEARHAKRAKADAARTVLDRPVTLQFNDATLRVVFEAVSKSAGLNILLDRDVKPLSRVSIFVKDISVEDAIDFILMQNQLEKRLVNSNTLMIYPSTDAKKAEYEDLTIRSFQVTNADIKYLSAMLKTMLKLREVAADERTGILVIRDTPERLRLAARLIEVHDMPDPEIMLEVEILEVSTVRRSNLGLLPPTSFTVLTPGAPGTLTLEALRRLRSGDLLVSPLSATLNFRLEDADAKLLASPRIRARNREPARIMIGDRVPTISNTVTPINTGSSVVTGTVSYQDVGLKLEFEPQVYANNEVGIRIALEVSNIAAEFTDPQGGRSYQIGTRNASTNLRLKDGETQILGGLITDHDRNVASKIPGLGHLPVVGRIFGNNDGTDIRSEIVLSITPRIVRNLPAQTPANRNIFSGTLNVLREKPILADPPSILHVAPSNELSAGQTPRLSPGTPPVPVPVQAGQVFGGGAPGAPVLFNPARAPSGGTTRPASAPESGSPALPSPPPMQPRPAYR